MKLADLMKRFGLSAKEESAQVDLKDTEELQELLAAFDEKETQLIEALDQIDELTKQMEKFEEAKVAAEQAAAEAVAKAHKEKVEARMSKLAAEFGDEKAAKFEKFAETMNDTEFAEVFGVQKELAAKQDESFAESGVDAKVKEEKKPAHFKQFIKKQGK
jgi:hypothetical protein